MGGKCCGKLRRKNKKSMKTTELDMMKHQLSELQEALQNSYKRIAELTKQKDMKNLVGYKVEIIFTSDKTQQDPADWVLEAAREGKFKKNTKMVHATSVAPIDLYSDEYKWLVDAKS